MGKYYRDYAEFLAGLFDGKVQKISVDAGLGCPNRDGTFGYGGCIYCNNKAFSPDYAKRLLPIEQQVENGKRFFAGKYPAMRYLAYFQSYTGSHGKIDMLADLYHRALSSPDVVGLIIGTRPDCMPDGLLERLREIESETGKTVILEFGAESSHDETLKRINRCHSWDTTVDAVNRSHSHGFHTGLHFILGLPGEDTEMIMQTIDRVNELPVSTVKFHQLQILRDTPLAKGAEEGLFDDRIIFTPESYAELCVRIIHRLRKDIAIERFVAQAPPELLLSPRWGLKNYQFTNLLAKYLSKE